MEAAEPGAVMEAADSAEGEQAEPQVSFQEQ